MLSVLEALSVVRDEASYLVVLTPCQELGESVLAQAIEPGILPVNRWDLIREAFGTKKLEPSLSRNSNSWLAEALLDAQPVGGWRKLTGPVLGRETAMNRLAAVRLGLSADADDTGVDAAALLEWTLAPRRCRVSGSSGPKNSTASSAGSRIRSGRSPKWSLRW